MSNQPSKAQHSRNWLLGFSLAFSATLGFVGCSGKSTDMGQQVPLPGAAASGGSFGATGGQGSGASNGAQSPCGASPCASFTGPKTFVEAGAPADAGSFVRRLDRARPRQRRQTRARHRLSVPRDDVPDQRFAHSARVVSRRKRSIQAHVQGRKDDRHRLHDGEQLDSQRRRVGLDRRVQSWQGSRAFRSRSGHLAAERSLVLLGHHRAFQRCGRGRCHLLLVHGYQRGDARAGLGSGAAKVLYRPDCGGQRDLRCLSHAVSRWQTPRGRLRRRDVARRHGA